MRLSFVSFLIGLNSRASTIVSGTMTEGNPPENEDATQEASSKEMEELEEALCIIDHLHNIFVLALVISTIVSGIVWIYERVLYGARVGVPLEIQAILVFFVAFTSTFYITNAKKLRLILTALGALLLAGVAGAMYLLLTRVDSLEEAFLVLASFILGVFGHALYFNRKLMERVEWLLLMTLICVLVAVVLVFLLTL